MLNSGIISVCQSLKTDIEVIRCRYCIIGAVAEAAAGLPVSPRKVEVLCEMQIFQAQPLAIRLTGNFDIDVQAASASLKAGKGIELVHKSSKIPTSIDYLGTDSYERIAFERKKDIALSPGSADRVSVLSADDVILIYLRKLAKETPDKPPVSDAVVSVLKSRKDSLDLDHIDIWAGRMHFYNFWERTMKEAGI